MENWCVYILKGDRYYIGYIGNLEQRLQKHRSGGTKTTRELGKWELVKTISCDSKTNAIKLEKKIKKGGHPERRIS